MKQLFAISMILVFITSCKKEISNSEGMNTYLANINEALQDSLPREDFTQLDFSKTFQTIINKDTSFLVVAIKDKPVGNEFYLLQTSDRGIINRGRRISIYSSSSQSNDKARNYNGNISIRTLNGVLIVNSAIVNGFVSAFHPKNTTSRTGSSLDPYVELPEVVVVAYLTDGGGMSYSSWMNLLGIMNGGMSGSSGTYSYYNDYVYGGGYSSDGYWGGGSTGGGGGDPYQDPTILIDFEYQDTDPAIEIDKYLACFNSVSDIGASCTIEILADIPVDSDPSKFFNWDSRSPGHVFLKLNKSNGSQIVQQSFGWYPVQGFKLLLTTAPITGKFVDNQHHEFNAAYTMNITPAQFQSTITYISYLSRFIKYDIDEYNCTDFVLDVFNHTASSYDDLEIPKYDLPGTTNPYGTNTPNGLYQKLQSIQNAGGEKSLRVNIPGYKGWVGPSNGACN